MSLFGKKLRLLRRSKGLTQAELGEATGYTHGAISALERGRRPALRVRRAMAEFFKIDVTELPDDGDDACA